MWQSSELYGSAPTVAAQPDHQILFALHRSEQQEILVGESRVEKAPAHGDRGGGDAAGRLRGVDFDQLAEDVARQRVRRRRFIGTAR